MYQEEPTCHRLGKTVETPDRERNSACWSSEQKPFIVLWDPWLILPLRHYRCFGTFASPEAQTTRIRRAERNREFEALQDTCINQLQEQPCAVEYRWATLHEAFGSFNVPLLEAMAAELFKSAQHQQQSPPYLPGMFSVTQLMLRQIRQVWPLFLEPQRTSANILVNFQMLGSKY